MNKFNRVVFAPEIEGAGGETTPPSPSPSLDSAAIKELNSSIAELVSLAKRPAPQQQTQPAHKADEDDEDLITSEDLELMTRAQFADYIGKRITGAIEKQVMGPLNERLGKITNQTEVSTIQTAVKETATQYPDFWEFKDEMIALANQIPGLTPERAYRLAKAEASEAKIKAVVEKYKPKDDGQKTPKKLTFGGLQPTASGTGNRSQKMAPKDAATSAWDMVASEMGFEPSLQEE